MMEKKLFYNPIWMPSKEMIILSAVEIPESVNDMNVEKLELYLEHRYLKLSEEAFQQNGKKILEWYQESIDDNSFCVDAVSLARCLVQSDQYCHLISSIKRNIKENVMPEWIIGSSEAIDLVEGHGLYEVLHLFQVYIE